MKIILSCMDIELFSLDGNSKFRFIMLMARTSRDILIVFYLLRDLT